MRVCVVGAGFAGLAAAVDLLRRGHEVDVLEARRRVGGRVWSDVLPTPHGEVVIERGAEFVLEGYDVLRRRAGDAGLEVADTGMSYYVRDVPGVARDELRDAGLQLMADAQRAATGTTVTELLAGLSAPPSVVEALRARVEISCAASADELDAAVVVHVASFSPRPSHRIAGGNQRLAEALAAPLGADLHLGQPARGLVRHDGGVTVRTDSGEVTADRVVLAIPAPLLLDLPVEPALPAPVLDAYRRLAYGHAAKLHVPLGTRPPTTAVMAVEDRFWSWTPTGPDGAVGAAVHLFAGSRDALAGLHVQDGPTRWIERLSSLRPGLDLVADQAVLTAWSEDPWALGAYSAWAVGAPIEQEALRHPVGAIHLAGEHTAGEWSGLMEGALRSGERVAAEVHAAVG